MINDLKQFFESKKIFSLDKQRKKILFTKYFKNLTNYHYKKCIEWGNKIEHMGKTIWLIILYSIAKENGIHKIKESDIFKKYEGSFKNLNWEDVIDSIRFKPEDKKVNFLLAFANKIFPKLKIVDKTA